MKSRILVVDDEPTNLESTAALLEEWGYRVETADSGLEAIQILNSSEKSFALVLLDYRMPAMNGAETTKKILEASPETIILMYSCDASRETLKESFRSGAVDFIDKDENIETLKTAIEMAYLKFEENLEVHRPIVNKAHNSALLASVGMIGQSQKMAEVAKRCLNYREYDHSVLILGETGTGKELVAQAIHGKNKAQFYAVNCASFAEGHLIEAELFGYEKGAFTGAQTRKSGILEAAGNGTVFLDEIDHLSPRAQASLLRAVREKKIRRVGATNESPISCRILASAKPKIKELVESGSFLPDLYFRLKFLTIEVPPLRERTDDIGLLVEHFAKEFGSATSKKVSFRARTIRLFEKYNWPGNVGELQGYVSELLVNSVEGFISPNHLERKFTLLDVLGDQNSTLADLEKKHQEETAQLVKGAIQRMGSQRAAAAQLGIAESSFRKLLGRLGISKTITSNG